MVTYLLPAKWPFLHAIPHPFQLGWLILSIFDNVIAQKKSPFPLRIFCLFEKLPKCFSEPAITFYIPTSKVCVAILCIPLAYDVTVFFFILPITGIC